MHGINHQIIIIIYLALCWGAKYLFPDNLLEYKTVTCEKESWFSKLFLTDVSVSPGSHNNLRQTST